MPEWCGSEGKHVQELKNVRSFNHHYMLKTLHMWRGRTRSMLQQTQRIWGDSGSIQRLRRQEARFGENKQHYLATCSQALFYEVFQILGLYLLTTHLLHLEEIFVASISAFSHSSFSQDEPLYVM